jgi:hypothetical protein
MGLRSHIQLRSPFFQLFFVTLALFSEDPFLSPLTGGRGKVRGTHPFLNPLPSVVVSQFIK